MAKRNYIDFDKEEVPVIFDIELAEDTYTMGINYNQTNDFFSVDLWDIDGNVIVLGEKMMLNRPLFEDIVDERLPAPTLTAMDEAGNEKRVTYENFGVTVFLFVDDIGDPSEEPNVDDYDTNDNLNGDDPNVD
ncbi:phage baseplate plug protein [Heyndrickxia acidicola]|uniref:Cyanophage baseplate Pam3 plug gp18 domain-containing protein n=1 Tax=Heyndrickxia acidicola TaxID=209389 RepID=A0ABU6MFX9_9BACI|nr:hypothetical protein [Heyndrickxia acidicola]MED1201945.1 hypothetical protein [Heyndrickxia acidicola]